MSTIFFDVVVSNQKAYHVEIRKMNMPDGFSPIPWVYEITSLTSKGKPDVAFRGTVNDLKNEMTMRVIFECLADYEEYLGTFSAATDAKAP